MNYFSRTRQVASLIAGCVLTSFAAATSWDVVLPTKVNQQGGQFVDIFVPKGDYSSLAITGAWNPTNGAPGYWLAEYAIASSTSLIRTGALPFYDTPSEALRTAKPTFFHIDTDSTLRLYIGRTLQTNPDRGSIPDVGSVTVRVQRVPENPFFGGMKDRLEKGFAVMQSFMDPGMLASTFQAYISSGNINTFIRELGQHIPTDLSGSLMRIGGVITSTMTSFLNEEVARGVDAVLSNLRDTVVPQSSVNIESRALLRELFMNGELSGEAPIMPKSNENGVNRFDTRVKAGVLHTLDPALATGFVYETGDGDPSFASVALPYLGPAQDKYQLSLWNGTAWINLAEVAALEETALPSGTRKFRVDGINTSAHPSTAEWISGVSFEADG